VNLRAFFERIGADTTAKFVAFAAPMTTPKAWTWRRRCIHKLAATKYAKEPIADPFGFPPRFRTATKLGFKNAKWVTAIEVTNDFPDTFLAQARVQLVRRVIGRN
jgi:DMSO/TMAO reductase YedYZ molybdopterin-dependent catalytic subunit